MIPVIEQSFGPSAYVTVRARQVLLAVPFHTCPHQNGGIQKLLTSDITLAESMPATQDPSHFREHVLREYVSIRACPTILEGFELSDNMSPAELPDSFFVVRTVSRMVVGGNHSLEDIAQNGSEDLGPPDLQLWRSTQPEEKRRSRGTGGPLYTSTPSHRY